MARTTATDFYQAFNFFAEAAPPQDAALEIKDFMAEPDAQLGQAGFTTCTLPELTVESVEYKEGHERFKRKYPGIETWSDLTLARGLARNASAFLNWALRAGSGQEYRSDLTVYHWQKAGKVPGKAELTSASSRYKCQEAFPVRCKVGSDLDANTSDVSVTEIDVAFENCTITRPDSSVINP